MVLNFLLFSSLLFTCTLGGEVYPPPELMEEVVKPLHELCTQRLKVTDDDVASYNIDTNTPDMKCYMKCLMLESKWMKASGEIDYDFIIASSHPSIKHVLDPALAKCNDVEKNDDLCEYAYNFNVCLHNADSVHYFLP